jgi:predicted nucleic-acid-binding protein
MSEYIFVDTNVFLRFFVADIEDLYKKAKRLFEKAENGETRLITSEMVVAEIVWVLESYYGFMKEEVKEVVETLLHSKGIRVLNSKLIGDALNNYMDSNVDFIDAYNGNLMKKRGFKKVATFDKKHFKRMQWIELMDM